MLSSAEDKRRAVALVHIAVHRHRATDGSSFLEHADGHGEIVDHAKTFAVLRKSVVKTAAHVDANSIFECELCRQNGAAGVEHERLHYLRQYGISISSSSRAVRLPSISLLT